MKKLIKIEFYGQLVTRQVFDIFVVRVDYFAKFSVVDDFFVHVHFHNVFKLWIGRDILADDFGNTRTP